MTFAGCSLKYPKLGFFFFFDACSVGITPHSLLLSLRDGIGHCGGCRPLFLWRHYWWRANEVGEQWGCSGSIEFLAVAHVADPLETPFGSVVLLKRGDQACPSSESLLLIL